MSPQSDFDFRKKHLHRLPGVGKLMEHVSENCPRALLAQAVNEVVDAHKKRILTAKSEDEIRDMDLSFQHFVEEVHALAVERSRMSLRKAINATGDLLSGSLGGAPMNEPAQKALLDVAGGYSTLAVDGDRDSHVRGLLSILTGARDGLIVNNNSAAIMLILNTIADGKEVIVSRGQLIEYDGFRLPEIIGKSGARLVSVGATNKTRLSDYRDALSEDTGAILRVHRSNYRIAGFSQDVAIQELAELGKEHNTPVVDDIGGGCLVDLTQHGLPEEPPAFLSIRSGANIVCFSGNKLLSGPQAGIVIGDGDYITMMRGNPLYRVLRAGKLVIAALEATLRSYLDTDRILQVNPALQLLSRSPKEMKFITRSVAKSLTEKLAGTAIVEIEHDCSSLVSVEPTKMSVDALDRKLRSRSVPIIAIVRESDLLLDFRTVLDGEEDEIAAALVECCQP